MDKEELSQNNASDIYNSLSELKWFGLESRQWCQWIRNLLQGRYQDSSPMASVFCAAFVLSFGSEDFSRSISPKTPGAVLNTFTRSAINAASIGQVHQANPTKDGKILAVKIQIHWNRKNSCQFLIWHWSDLLLCDYLILNERELDHYMGEVEEKLLEETDYILEVQRSRENSWSVLIFPNLKFT